MPLLPVHEALRIVRECTLGGSAERVPWNDVLGRVLAEPVLAAVDDPPFDRSSMDGYAMRAADAASGRPLTVLERVAAGSLPGMPVGPLQATKVMTGAPIPEGADCVLPVEDCDDEAGVLRLREVPGRGDHIRRRGENVRSGDPIFPRGRQLDLLDVAVGDALCVADAAVYGRPSAAVLSTGSELVPPGRRPGPGQIVNTNGPMLARLWRSWGGEILGEAVVPDEAAALESAIGEGLRADVLVLSGGVSAGDLDLVPQILRSLGVEVLFHKVRMKPGKPVLFGRGAGCVVLGLPGNPVSAFVGAQLFLREVCRGRSGLPAAPWRLLPLAAEEAGGGSRTRFEPGAFEAGGAAVRLLEHKGSADLPAWRQARCLVELPHDAGPFPRGTPVRCLPLGRAMGGGEE